MYYYRNKRKGFPIIFIVLAIVAGIMFASTYKTVETPVYSIRSTEKYKKMHIEDIEVIYLLSAIDIDRRNVEKSIRMLRR